MIRIKPCRFFCDDSAGRRLALRHKTGGIEPDFMRSAKGESFSSMPSASGGIARLACAGCAKRARTWPPFCPGRGSRSGTSTIRPKTSSNGSQIKLLELANELHDEFLRIQLGAELRPARDPGLLYYIMASSEQLADALRKAGRYSAGSSMMGSGWISVGTAAAAITLDYVKVDRRSDRHQMEFWLVTLMRICRAVTDTRLTRCD